MKDLDALRTIGEVAQIISVPVYVIRFWEKKFDSIKPIKAGEELTSKYTLYNDFDY